MFRVKKSLGETTPGSETYHIMRGGFISFFLAIFLLFPFQVQSTTQSFQDGVSPEASYTGTSDTYMDATVPTTNKGSWTEILIDGSPDYGTIIKWDVSSISSGTVIQSASITLTAFNGTDHTYEVYEMKRDWDESQATWNQYASGNNWQTSGAQGANDRGVTVLGTITGSTGAQTITLNSSGIALVQSWVDNPSTNFGITIQDYSGASDGIDIYSSEYATASWRPMITVQYGSSGVVESRVSTGNDDAEEKNPPNGNMVLNSSDLELIRDGSTDQEVGMRFNNITLSQGITIANAYIQFTVDETGSETTNLTFYGDDTDNAPTFSNSSSDITNRTKTSASVNWNNVPAWNSIGAADSDQRTPDLSSIIQEIVDRPGWSSGNSIVIIVDGSGKRTAESYDGSSGSAPLLHIQYGTGSASQTYYVRTDGNDSNTGTSNSSSGAWQTIQKAASTITAGDSVLVQPGTYYENVTPANSGTAGNSIVFKADGTVVMDGQNNSGYAFYMNGKDYIVIDGFTITNWPDGGGTHATVKFRNSDNGVVRNCIIHNTGRDAIYFHGSSNNCLVENNLIYNIDDDGISPRGNGDHTIRNNTFYSCGGWAVEHTNTNGNVYENNIFWDNLDNDTGSNVTFSYNDYIGGVLTGTGNISSDPLFVNASGNDYHISHTAAGQSLDSPCIDAGSATAVSLGLDTRTTRTDQVVDAGQVDLGYHYLSGVVSFTDWTSVAGLGGCTNEYGIAWGDYNNDGYPDIYITKRNALYKNNGNGTFSTNPPYLYCANRSGHWADYDNDGDLDFASTYNMYFSKNNGDGTFTHQNNSTIGLTHINNLGDVGWLDYNEDGYLDLWAPNGSNPYTYMYSNDGDGTFTGVAGSTIGLTANTNGETTVVTDYDGDGHTDILYRASSLFLWHSNGDGTFTNVTSSAGVSLSGTGGGYNGTAFGDYDNDGDLDFYGGQSGSNKLYRNDGDGTFTDVTSTAGVAGFSKTTKGVAWGDYDNDGDLDLYIAHQNGANQLFQNDGSGSFTDVAPGLGLNDNSKSYGVEWADFDLDGDLDLFVGNKQNHSKLFKNNIVSSNYLKVKVRGAGAGNAPIDGTGSRVELWNSSGTTLFAVREISGGEGMGSHPQRIVHFGLDNTWGGSSGTYLVKVKFTSSNQVIAQNVIPDQRSITIGSTTLNQTIEVFEGSLLAEIRFDECSWDGSTDDVADSSGNANHGTSYGGATTSIGKVCNAGVFNGSTGYVSVSSSPPIGDFSYSVWVKPGSAASSGWHQVISSWYTSWKDAFRMSISSNKVTIGVEDGSGYYVSSSAGSIQDGNWYHIVGVKEGNDLKLYLNGGFINSVGSVPNPFNGSPTDFAIGRNPHYSGGEYFAGFIDELLIYDKALSSTEINTIYTNQLAGLNTDGTSRTCRECVPPTPLTWWQMDECEWTGASGEVADASGNGNHGTAFGDATTIDGKVCKGGIFDGNNDYVDINMNLGSTVTISVWAKSTASSLADMLWCIDSDNHGPDLFFYGGKISLNTWDSANNPFCNIPSDVDEWHLYTTVIESGNTKLYIDESLSGTASYRNPTGTDFHISSSAGYDWEGTIDEVRIYDQGLNLDQVKYLYNQTHSCPDCVPDPVAVYYMDECAWTGSADEVADSSGNGNHGTTNGDATTTSNGKVCYSGVFDGVDDYVNIGNGTSLDLTPAGMTIGAWVYNSSQITPSGVDFRTIVGRRPDGVTSGYGLSYGYWTGDGASASGYRVDLVFYGGYQGTIDYVILPNQWYHIVGVFKNNVATIYVNGVALPTTNIGTGYINIMDDVMIGRHGNWSARYDYHDGPIDEVHIYDQALTSSDVQTLYAKTHPCPDCEVTHNIEYFPKNRWVMMGVPVLPDPADAMSVVGDDFGSQPPYWRVIRWVTDLEGYAFYQEDGEGPYALPGEEPPEFAPGLGFWVIQSLLETVTIDVTGVEMDDNFSVDIVGPPTGATVGRNMIANPYSTVIDWSDVKITDGSTTLSITQAGTQGWINSHAYVWNWDTSVYEVITPDEGSNQDSISVREGFWVEQMSSSELDLIFKKTSGQPRLLAKDRLFVSRYGDEVRPMNRTEILGLEDWSGILYLHTEDGSYTALDNRFGVNPDADDGYDGFDATWLDPGTMSPAYGALYFIASDGSELVHDIRNSEWLDQEQTWHFRVKDINVNGNWWLRWPNISNIPGSVHLSLESPEGTTIIPDLRDSLYYGFSLSSGSEKDFYLHAIVTEDSTTASTNIGFVQNPGITKYLDIYLFPDEALDFMFLYVDGSPVPISNVDELYNVFRGSLEMFEGGEKEVILFTMDLSNNEKSDTSQYNFELVGGSTGLFVQAPGDQALLSIPGGTLPEGTWVGLGVQKAKSKKPKAESEDIGSWDLGLGSLNRVYSIQPFGLTFPPGSELVLPISSIDEELGSVQVYRETSKGRIAVPATYNPMENTIHATVGVSGNYVLLKSTKGIAGILPTQTSLLENYPNPFNALTVIPYTLQEPAMVSIKIYDLLGREVTVLVNEYQEVGYYRQSWNGRDQFGRVVSTGVYFVRFEAGTYFKTKKLMLLK